MESTKLWTFAAIALVAGAAVWRDGGASLDFRSMNPAALVRARMEKVGARSPYSSASSGVPARGAGPPVSAGMNFGTNQLASLSAYRVTGPERLPTVPDLRSQLHVKTTDGASSSANKAACVFEGGKATCREFVPHSGISLSELEKSGRKELQLIKDRPAARKR